MGSLQRLAVHVNRFKAVVKDPEAEVIALKAAAVDHGGVLFAREHAGYHAVAVHVVCEEHGVL